MPPPLAPSAPAFAMPAGPTLPGAASTAGNEPSFAASLPLPPLYQCNTVENDSYLSDTPQAPLRPVGDGRHRDPGAIAPELETRRDRRLFQ